MYRINDVSKGINKPLFSCKKEILLKTRCLSTNDVEKVFKKVKEALEVSQHVLLIKTCIIAHQITGERPKASKGFEG